MRRIVNIASIASVAFLMIGCSSGGQPSFPASKKSDGTVKLQAVRPEMVASSKVSKEAMNKCSMHTYLYLAARETLASGNNYFVLADPGHGWKYDNNMMGFPITDSDALERYCNPELRSPDTGLENDKCLNRHMGNPIKTQYSGHIAMLKEQTYLFPTWNARETMQKEGAKANACIDWSKYKEASSVKDIKVSY